MEKIQKQYKWYTKLGLTLLILVAYYLLYYLFNPFSSFWESWLDGSTANLLLDLVVTSVICWLIIESSILITNILEHYFLWTRLPLWRFVAQIVLQVIATVIILLLQHLFYELIFEEITLDKWQYLEIRQSVLLTVIISLFVSAVHISTFLLDKWKLSISEAADLRIKSLELKEIAMQAELQSLKIQLDPHFMFNNFSTLSELINDDTELAASFLRNLSRVYRYMIQNQKKDLVLLSEEIAFVRAYFYLMYIRHDNNVQLNIELADEVLKQSIPPISVQLLIENAIKHNIATKEKPLVIHVTSDNGSVSVSNNLQRISNIFPSSTGIGLQNIQDRYRILSDYKSPQITETADRFCVSLPLFNSNE